MENEMKIKKKGRAVGTDLTSGPVMTKLIIFSFPLILTGIVQQLYIWVDLMIVGKCIGTAGTIGVSTGGEISDIATPFAMAFASAAQVYVAQLYGIKDHERIRETTGTVIAFMTLIACGMMLTTIILSGQILDLLNCPAEALTEADSYMVITALGIPFVFIYNGICGVPRGMGESRRPLQFILVAAGLNTLMDILFIVVLPWGVFGAALATMISQIGSCLAAFLYLYLHRTYFGLELKPAYFRIRKKPLLIILKLGIPNLIRVVLVHFSMLWVKAMVNDYGFVVSATNSIGGKIEKFATSFTISVNTASGAMMAQNIGAGKMNRASRTMWCTFSYNMILGGAAAAISWLIPRQIFTLFTDNPAVIDYGVLFLHIYSVTFLVAAFAGSFKSVINGVGAVILGLFLGILDGIVCRIGISLFGVHVLNLGAPAYFWGTAFTQLLPGLIAMIYFLAGRWKKKKLLTE